MMEQQKNNTAKKKTLRGQCIQCGMNFMIVYYDIDSVRNYVMRKMSSALFQHDKNHRSSLLCSLATVQEGNTP